MNAPIHGTVYPVLPLRDIVVFPGMIVPLFVGREKSVKALEEVMKDDKQILLIAQKNASQDDPGPDDIYSIGTLGTVLQLLKLPDDTVKVLVEGGRRVRVTGYSERADFFEARAVDMEEVPGDTAELQAAARTVVSEFENYVKLNKKVPPEVLQEFVDLYGTEDGLIDFDDACVRHIEACNTDLLRLNTVARLSAIRIQHLVEIPTPAGRRWMLRSAVH